MKFFYVKIVWMGKPFSELSPKVLLFSYTNTRVYYTRIDSVCGVGEY